MVLIKETPPIIGVSYKTEDGRSFVVLTSYNGIADSILIEKEDRAGFIVSQYSSLMKFEEI